MYITIRSVKRTLGKYIEMMDLYIGLPMLFIFLIMFSFTNYKVPSLIFLTSCVFMMLPVTISKKNRMYKVFWLLIKYLFKVKDFTYEKEVHNETE